MPAVYLDVQNVKSSIVFTHCNLVGGHYYNKDEKRNCKKKKSISQRVKAAFWNTTNLTGDQKTFSPMSPVSLSLDLAPCQNCIHKETNKIRKFGT